MKTIIIACGAGVATSTIIVDRVKNLLKDHKIEANIIQCTAADIDAHVYHADLIITSMKLDKAYAKPVITGIPFLTGVGRAETEQEVLRHLTD
jgi:PTS system galactitol-specific IIB component